MDIFLSFALIISTKERKNISSEKETLFPEMENIPCGGYTFPQNVGSFHP